MQFEIVKKVLTVDGVTGGGGGGLGIDGYLEE